MPEKVTKTLFECKFCKRTHTDESTALLCESVCEKRAKLKKEREERLKNVHRITSCSYYHSSIYKLECKFCKNTWEEEEKMCQAGPRFLDVYKKYTCPHCGKAAFIDEEECEIFSGNAF